jgi:hypothetical protein
MTTPKGVRRLLSLVNRERLPRLLGYMLDEAEFLSPNGVRSLSKIHEKLPFVMSVDGHDYRVGYEPAESRTSVFGGNSNWRGPVWFPPNFLMVESLQQFHHYYGDDLRVDCPTGSGHKQTLWEVAAELSHRMSRLFLQGADGIRPALKDIEPFAKDPDGMDGAGGEIAGAEWGMSAQ